MKLISVYREPWAIQVLYDLLKERTPEQSISHKKMPTMAEHRKFVLSKPYRAWYLMKVGEECVGSVYLTHAREVGIFVFSKFRGNGAGRLAIDLLRKKHPGRLLANVNPKNLRSVMFFAELGARHIQNTYELP